MTVAKLPAKNIALKAIVLEILVIVAVNVKTNINAVFRFVAAKLLQKHVVLPIARKGDRYWGL